MALTKQNHTQVSNDFIDKWMAKLSGSGVKVFMAISRKTIGWHKDVDRISQGQLCELCGLSVNGVKKAIEELKDQNLITVCREGIGKNTKTYYEINYNVPENDTKNPDNVSQNDTKDPFNVSESDTTKERILLKKEDKENICVSKLKKLAKTRGTPPYPSSFNEWYNVYPNQQNKKATLYNWCLCIESGAKESDLYSAAINYANHCKKEKIDKKYIKHSTTFLGPAEPWRDWVRLGITDLLVTLCPKCGNPRTGTEGFCVKCGEDYV